MSAGANMSGVSRAWLMAAGLDGNIDWTWTLDAAPSEFNGIIDAASGGAFAYGAISTDGYLVRLSAPAGIAGIVRELESNTPVAGVRVTTLGSSFAAITDSDGRYALARSPGTYSLTAYGPCVEADTFGTIEAFADSIVEMDLTIGVPDYYQPQTSLNLTAHNHLPSTMSVALFNLGSGELAYAIEAHTVSPPTDWLSVEPSIGSIAAGESLVVTITVEIDTTDDGAFDLFGYLSIRSNSCPDSTDYLPVLVTVLDADEPRLPVPAKFTLHVFPNPFNSMTSISFSLPTVGDTRLEIFDVSGRRVRELVRDRLSAGEHRVYFDAAPLPSGLYLARLSSEAFTKTQKLLLLK